MFLTTTRRAAEPAAELFTGLNRLNRMMDEALGSWNGSTIAAAWMPACDVVEDKNQLKIALELPGVRPEDVKVNLENHTLTISGEKKQVTEDKNERWHRYERSYGSFERTFTLPSTVDAEHVQATVEHGVLTLVLPKAERAKPREIPVKASA
jgi:HSP20 family protein